MKKTGGYIEISRRVIKLDVFKSPNAWQLLTYILFNATSIDGELILETSYKEIFNDLNAFDIVVEDCLNYLEDKNFITYDVDQDDIKIKVVMKGIIKD